MTTPTLPGLDLELRITGDRVVVWQGGAATADVPVEQLVRAIHAAGAPSAKPEAKTEVAAEVIPRSVRIWERRRDATAVAVELPPQTRRVRWLSDGSKVPFGRKARYDSYFVAFPYVVLLLVFRGGSLTGLQQLYYRTAPLGIGGDDALLLPNLYNVAQGYGQRCWLCLQHAPDVTGLAWQEKLDAIVEHTFAAAFNRSSEMHEGNSYWTPEEAVDPRVAGMKAWHEATRENPRFPLEVAWKPAETTARGELLRMLEQVVAAPVLQDATALASLLTSRPRGRKRRPKTPEDPIA